MATIKQLYPATDTTALTITLASLASSASLVAGRQSTVVDNTTNLDLDHLLSGRITIGTGPTADKSIQVWAFAPYKVVAGAYTYPDTLGALDAAVTLTSAYVKNAALVHVATITTEAVNGQIYYLRNISIASLFGDMPSRWGIFVTQDTGVALHATASVQELYYLRVQKQSV